MVKYLNDLDMSITCSFNTTLIQILMHNKYREIYKLYT